MRGRERGQAKSGWCYGSASVHPSPPMPRWATLALVEMDGRSCRELLVGRAHRRSLGYARDDKLEGGGPPWHEWRWMDRVEKKLIWTRLTLSRPLRQAQGRLFGTDRDTP